MSWWAAGVAAGSWLRGADVDDVQTEEPRVALVGSVRPPCHNCGSMEVVHRRGRDECLRCGFYDRRGVTS